MLRPRICVNATGAQSRTYTAPINPTIKSFAIIAQKQHTHIQTDRQKEREKDRLRLTDINKRIALGQQKKCQKGKSIIRSTNCIEIQSTNKLATYQRNRIC